jgi:hypothetical protein
MPKKKERTTTKASWRTETMQALSVVASGESTRKAAINFNIPFRTIKDRVKAGKCYRPSLGKRCIFNEEQ